MRFRNAVRGIHAARIVFSAIACCMAASPGLARPGGTAIPIAGDRADGPSPGSCASPSASPEPILGLGQANEDREPDLESGIAAFLTLRGWLDDDDMPPLNDPASALKLPGARGVAVVLRHRGRTVAVGTDWPTGTADEHMLRRAFGRALAKAVGDPMIAELPRELRDASLRELAVELDLAARPEPLLGRTFAECVTRFEPGLDGLAMRRGGGNAARWAAWFPSVLQATNISAQPDRAFFALLSDLDLPLKDLPDLVRTDPVGVFRFPSLRLAQSTADELPFIRGRGAPRFSEEHVTRERTVEFASAALSRLALSVAAAIPQAVGKDLGGGGESGLEGIGLFGSYQPVADEFKPIIAPPLEQAIVAWAAASVARSERFPSAVRASARRLAQDLLFDLALRTSAEESPSATVPPMAFAICAIAALGEATALPDPVREFAALARDKLLIPLQTGDTADRSLAALASAMALMGEGRIGSTTDTRDALDALWSSVPPDELVGHLPWLVMGEIAYSRNTGQPLAHADRAMAVAELLFAVQAGFGSLTSEVDLRGGFRLSGASRNSVTSQSLRPGLGMAAMAAHPGFAPPERRAELERRVRALVRFAMELGVDERESRFFRNPLRAEGGVRVSLWDATMPVSANAMAILVAVEAADSLAPGSADGASGQPARDASTPEVSIAPSSRSETEE